MYLTTMVLQLLYTPQLITSLLTATAFSYRQDSISASGWIQGVAWIMQFIGHGVAEKRAPALLDNILGGLMTLASVC
jgi:2-hydroxy fatty acid dioxygenase